MMKATCNRCESLYNCTTLKSCPAPAHDNMCDDNMCEQRFPQTSDQQLGQADYTVVHWPSIY